jgi:hypothetical protein
MVVPREVVGENVQVMGENVQVSPEFRPSALQETVKFTRAKITYDGPLVSYITYDGPSSPS